ncbi:polysaccharide biosynthesis protein [Amphibiibacter pelophylacis]|uniref:Nucleoside-diphosphate sugar epimerase/dehydratase n=1 Tax=Amphibiibacter pelophylacis TaxID=1799477 RepID=A0ACC6NZ82_9BURK
MTVKTWLISRPRRAKQLLVAVSDVALSLLALWLAFLLRLDRVYVPKPDDWVLFALVPAVALPMLFSFGVYRAVYRHAGLKAFHSLLRAIMHFAWVYAVLAASLVWGLGLDALLSRSVLIIMPLLLALLLSVLRVAANYWLNSKKMFRKVAFTKLQVLIYGAGSAGIQTMRAMRSAPEFYVVGFLDDDPALQGRTIDRTPVYDPADLDGVIEQTGATDVVLAMPSAPRTRRSTIVDRLRAFPIHVRTLPGMSDLALGKVRISDLRELDIEDLLGRDPVAPDEALLHRHIRGKTVLVTGAGGSIGSELCRQIVQGQPVCLILVDVSEYALYAIHRELEGWQRQLRVDESGEAYLAAQTPCQIVPLLASVRDLPHMRRIMQTWRPATVYHAAAYKHVPMVEGNVSEGVRNNVLGTLHAALAARDAGVEAFVLISTDKAVRPTNIMGASKRLAELVLQALAAQDGVTTCFSMVRFGNVLGSSGSVVPLFREQIKAGGPITVTHADVTRYFMTIPEAAQLVIQAGAMAHGGDVFVLDMGEPVKISQLARRMIELSGLTVRDTANPSGDIAIAVTGLRPGEKLYEELLIGDNPRPTSHPRIMKAVEVHLSWSELQKYLQQLDLAFEYNDVPAVRRILAQLVSGFAEHGEVVDSLFVQEHVPVS